MSKKRHRDRRNDDDMQNNMGLNPQMLDMLKANNIDVSKFSEMMSAMNKDGFNINNLSSLLSGGNMGGGLPGGMPGGFPGMGNMPSGMAGIASMLQNMNRNNRGFMNNNQNNMNNMNQNNMHPNNMNQNNMHQNNYSGNMQSKANVDENIEMLLSIKSVVNPQKAKFIDKVIEMYKNGEIKY